MNLLAVRRDHDAAGDADRRGEARTSRSSRTGCARRPATMQIQGTKPQTLAYGLTDSPVGLAAWIVEKFRTWSDCGGDVERRFSQGRAAHQRDALLGHRRHRLVVLALLRARATARWPISETPAGHGADGLRARSRARSCIRRGRGPSASTTSGAGRPCRPAATSPRSRSPRRWPPTSARSSATCAERGQASEASWGSSRRGSRRGRGWSARARPRG